MPEGQAELMSRTAKAELDKLYSGPIPVELQNRAPFIAMSTKGALDAIGHPATAPITAALPPQPAQPQGQHHVWDQHARDAAAEARRLKKSGGF